MRAKPYQELREKYFTPEERNANDAEARKIVLEVTLQELRKGLANLTQEQLAEFLEVSQAQISKYEKGGDMMISSLRRIVEAMGAEFRAQARLKGGDWVTLRDYSQPEKDLLRA
ncbi:MAG: helix-turn-helix transcriptional regulator [Myxococcota bacterium]